jgi:hypothetical protein
LDISRSEIGTIISCQERAYATYREDGTGYTVSGAEANITTLQGQALHDGGQIIFDQGPQSNWKDKVTERLSILPEPHRTIRTTLIRRALLGWSIKRYPEIIREWKPLGAEVPWKWEFAPGFRQPLRMDDLMEHRSHAGLAIFDFKTAGSPDLNWTERKKNSKQTHLYIKALKDVSGRHVSGMMYDCIEIGKWDNKKEIHKSPFVLGYQNKSGTVSHKYVYGAPIVDLTLWDDDKWLEWALKSNALEGLYWNTGLISPPDDQLIRTHEATIIQVQDWALKLAKVNNSIDPRAEANRQFQRNDEACLTYGWELKCPFYHRCWKGHKIDAETFEPRKNHHEPESV